MRKICLKNCYKNQPLGKKKYIEHVRDDYWYYFFLLNIKISH